MAPPKAVAVKKVAQPAPAVPVREREPIRAVLTGVEPMNGPVRQLKRAQKERFQVEHNVHSTPSVLYEIDQHPERLQQMVLRRRERARRGIHLHLGRRPGRPPS